MHLEHPITLLVEIDGVLADTRQARRAALAAAVVSLGIPPAALTISADAAEGRSFGEAVTTIARLASRIGARRGARDIDATDVELATLRAERAFEDAARQAVVLVPGARDALAALGERVRLGVVTRLSRMVTDAVLSFAGLEPVVRVVVNAPQGEPLSASTFRRALERLARGGTVVADAGVALVDAIATAEAAREAGLRPIVVGHGAPDATSHAPTSASWLATVDVPTYDALMQILARVRTP
ncbi:MAG: HAD family phosphatase [Gemmatirosa sp.]|nr:HAD family phosphatase [Gemmatirosa sp.]